MSERRGLPFTRRSFLAGAGALTLVACSGGGGNTATSTGSSSSSDFILGPLFASDALVPGAPQRMPFGLFNAEGSLADDPPAELTFAVLGPDERLIGEPVTVSAHSQGLPRAYYPLVFTPSAPGVYRIAAKTDGSQIEPSSVQIPATSAVPRVGQQMVPIDTPTETDPRGVEPICTRDPACTLHDVTLRDALEGSAPVAFLISTPRYCQTAICGPVLDVLLGVQEQFPTVKMLHAEVYPSAAAAQPNAQQYTEAVTANDLSYEPVLFLAEPDGTIGHRIDTIFDGVELREALTQLTS